jgi:hypothetical protein
MIKKKLKLFSPLLLLVVSSCGTLSSTSSEEWIKINYQTPTQSTISASTISYGKQTNGTYANLRRSESVLLDSKISPNEAKRAIGQTTPVSFFDEEGNTISIKPYLIDFIPFKDITYLVYSSIPLTEERYQDYRNSESSTHYPLLQQVVHDVKYDVDDIYSYYLVNNRSGKMLDLKVELRKFEIYYNQLKGFDITEPESNGSASDFSANVGHCMVVPSAYYFKILSFGFLAEGGCRQPGQPSYMTTDRILFSFDATIDQFTYRFADVSNVWFNFISSNGVGFGIVGQPSPRFPREYELIKYDFNTNEHEVISNLIDHFNPLIYTHNGVAQPRWFEQIYLQNPIMVDEEFVYYANFDNIVKLDLKLNFVDHIHRNSPNAHAYRTLQNFMDGTVPRFIGTMDRYHVYLVNEFNSEIDQNSARMMLIDLETIEITMSKTIPYALSYFFVVGTSLVGYNNSDIKDLELFQWKLETNQFISLYQFNLVSESQLHGDYNNLLPTPSNEVVNTGYTRILQPSTTSSRLEYQVISLLTGNLYGINENKPEQIILISKIIT